MNTDYPSLTRFQQFVELKDYRPPTKKEYLRHLRRLADHVQRDPVTLSQDEVRDYFLFLRQEKQFSGSTLSIAKAALQLFYRQLFAHPDWTVFSELVIRRGQPLPLVLDRTAVARLLATLRVPHFRTILGLIYQCGLRVGEAVRLKVTDIDGPQLRLWVRQGKGGKDRAVPLTAQVPEVTARRPSTWANSQ